ncbi:MAG: SDR family oxidoreductase [Actinobacteria bacterium]|nr:SDR family oxidoreductase [Actinomycetota bacterium]
MRFGDKVVIVTGSAQGMGRLFAEAISAEGGRVVVCDLQDCRETEKRIVARGGKVLALRTDVTSASSVEEMVAATVERFGRIDGLVNNAALYGGLQRKPFDELDEGEWDRVMAVNVKGPWLCAKAVVPVMREAGGGKIVNIASGVHFKGVPFMLHYTASKGAVVGFTRALAREVGPFKINVNAVAPGLVLTEASTSMTPQELIDGTMATQALKVPQDPAHIVGVVQVLAATESDYMTGQTLVVDGGSYMH